VIRFAHRSNNKLGFVADYDSNGWGVRMGKEGRTEGYSEPTAE